MNGDRGADLVHMGYERLGVTHRVFPFFHEMHKVYQSADVVVVRAGAGLIHEIAHFDVPAIIVPYPYAGAHQKKNAAAFLKEGGRGLMIEEKYLTAERLSGEIAVLIQQNSGGHDSPSSCFFKADAAQCIADIVCGGAGDDGADKTV